MQIQVTKFDFSGMEEKPEQAQHLGKSHEARRANFAMRVCRGCSRLANRVPRLFAFGTRLA